MERDVAEYVVCGMLVVLAVMFVAFIVLAATGNLHGHTDCTFAGRILICQAGH